MTLWINGDWITGQGASRVKRNPVSGEVLWQGNDADAAQVEQACRAARAAFPRWARLSFAERHAVVERFAALLESNKAELTAIIARETGKPRWEAATDVLIHLKYEKTGRTLDYSGSDGIRFGGACKPVAQILVVNQ